MLLHSRAFRVTSSEPESSDNYWRHLQIAACQRSQGLETGVDIIRTALCFNISRYHDNCVYFNFLLWFTHKIRGDLKLSIDFFFSDNSIKNKIWTERTPVCHPVSPCFHLLPCVWGHVAMNSGSFTWPKSA